MLFYINVIAGLHQVHHENYTNLYFKQQLQLQLAATRKRHCTHLCLPTNDVVTVIFNTMIKFYVFR